MASDITGSVGVWARAGVFSAPEQEGAVTN